MKYRALIGAGIRYGVAAALVCASAAPATAQAPADAAKKATPRPTAPPLTGPGSLNGVWNNSEFKDFRTGPPVGQERPVPTADGKPIPFQPWALALIEERRKATLAGKPVASLGSMCLPGGMPQVMHPPIELALQIVETPDQNQITVLFEFYGTFRIIHMNEKHPEDPDPGFMGNSVGHWEGGTLVVDTIALSDKTMIAGVPHGENLHLVERIRRTGENTLEDRVTIEDPKTFTRPWTMVYELKRVPGMRINEYVCENQRNGVLPDGSTAVEITNSGQ
jgi:hypothetical protein